MTFEQLPAWMPGQIDPGWATLIAAFLGFLAILKQARSGFESLRHSQERQAELSRESLIEQAELNRQARREEEEYVRQRDFSSMLKSRSTLAAALSGELISIYNSLSHRIIMADVQRDAMRRMGKLPVTDPSILDYSFNSAIYEESIERLGLLSPVTVTDIVSIYSSLKESHQFDRFKGVSGEDIAELLEGHKANLTSLQARISKLNLRLLYVYKGGEDPLVDEIVNHRGEETEEQH